MKVILLRYLVRLWLLLSPMVAFGYYGSADKSDVSLALSVAGQNTGRTSTATAVMPSERINGWLGVHVNRLVAENETVSEMLNTHVEGGFSIRSLKLNGYVDLDRNLLRGIRLSSEVGYFVETEAAEIHGIEVSGGAGNFTLNEQILKEIGLAEVPQTDGQKFGWLAFVTGRYKGVSGKVTVFPELLFKDVEVEASVSMTRALSRNMEIGVMGQACFDSAPFVDRKLTTSYMAFLRIKGFTPPRLGVGGK